MTTTEATMTERFTYSLTPLEFALTKDKVAKINARAEKRGFTGRLAVEGNRVEITTTDVLTGIDQVEVRFETAITGEAPRYGGWTFAARVDSLGDTFTLANAPGVDHVSREGIVPNACFHCNTSRARKTSYILRDETGRQVQVGSTCIKDFLGWDTNPVFISEDEVARDLMIAGSSGDERSYSVEYILTLAVAAIRAFGWVPASSYDGRPTSSYVWLALGNRANLSERERADLAALKTYAEEATEKAALVRDFVLSDDFNGTSTYVDNLKVAAAQPYVTGRQVNLLVSAPNAYTRHLEGQVKREVAAKVSETSGWVGQEKDKVTVEGTIRSIRYSSNNYGTTTIYNILSKDGNLFTWFSTNGALGDKEGVEVKIVGTVKKHDEYKGTKSTVLTRCKAI